MQYPLKPVLTALELLGNGLLHRNLVIQVKQPAPGETVVIFGREAATAPEPSKRPVARRGPEIAPLVSVTFKEQECRIEPLDWATHDQPPGPDNLLNLARIAIAGMTHLYRPNDVDPAFSLDVSPTKKGYVVRVWALPYYPDQFKMVEVLVSNGQIKGFRPRP